MWPGWSRWRCRGVERHRESDGSCETVQSLHVMAALVAAIHVFLDGEQDVDGRTEAGHDGERCAVENLQIGWWRVFSRASRALTT